MPKRVLTETFLQGLLKKPPRSRQTYTEPGRTGFQMRHESGGAMSFWVRVLRGDREVPMRLGVYPAMSLAQAHEEHAAARKLLAQGLDPLAEREAAAKAREAQERRAKITSAITIRNVVAEWAWHYARKHRKRPREAVRLLKVYFGKPLAGKPANEITKRDLVLVIDRVIARGSNVMANRLRDLVVQVFALAAERDLIPTSPAAGLRKKPGGEEESKERALSGNEIKAFWNAMQTPQTKISNVVRLGVKLILVTAQRPGEVASARFDQFDTQARVWTIPASIAKNGREHYVPLTDLAVEIVEELRGLAAKKNRPHLLPSHQSKLKPDEPLSERALSRALKNNHSGPDDKPRLFGLEPFTPHDLRRTASTHMTSLGIPRLHVQKLLNHADDEVTGIYDRHHYFDEKKVALETWESELRAITEGKERKIIPIKRAG